MIGRSPDCKKGDKVVAETKVWVSADGNPKTEVQTLYYMAPRSIEFTTHASRFGAEIAKAALRAGDRVVATGRKLASIAARVGRDSDQLLCLELDVCDPEKRAQRCARRSRNSAASMFLSITPATAI
jgi:hypothetical protein